MPEAQDLSLRKADAMRVSGARSKELWELQAEETGHLPMAVHPQGDQGGSGGPERHPLEGRMVRVCKGMTSLSQRTKNGEEEEGRGRGPKRGRGRGGLGRVGGRGEGRRVEGASRSWRQVGRAGQGLQRRWEQCPAGGGWTHQNCGCPGGWVGAGGQGKVHKHPWPMLGLWVFICQGGDGGTFY